MNRNLLKTLAAAAMTLLAAACAKEQVAGDGQTVEATFEVDVPGTVATKAIGDGMTASQLYYQVFDADANPIEGLGVQKATLENGKTKVSFQLIKDQTYNFVFWAQTPEEGYYTISTTDGLKSITADYATHKEANDENRDAFFAVETGLKVSGPISKNVVLKRPFAQLNIATKSKMKVGADEKDIDFSDATSSVKVVYIPTVFAPMSDTKQLSKTQTTTFSAAEIPSGNIEVAGETYRLLSMNYIFAPEDGSVYDVTATVKVGGKDYIVKVPSAPLKRNWKTNIVGDFLMGTVDFNVVVEPDFEDENDMDIANPKNEAELQAALATYGTVEISNNIDVASSVSSKQNSHLTVGKDVVLSPSADFKASYTETIFVGANTLTLDGEGSIVGPSNSTSANGSQAIMVQGGTVEIDGDLKIEGGSGSAANHAIAITNGTANIRGGYFHAGLDKNGKSSDLILLRPAWRKYATCNIYGGVFETEGDATYLVNMIDADRARCSVKIYGGTFVGFNPASVNEGDITSFVADGYRSVETTYDGKQAWKVEAIPAITPDGLAAALDAVGEGETAELYLGAGEFSFAKSNCKGNIVVKGTSKAETIVSVPNASRCYDNKSISFENVTLKCTNEYVNDAREAQFPRTDVSFVNCKVEGTFAAIGSVVASFKGCEFAAGTAGNAQYAIKYYGGDKTSKLVLDNCTFNTYGKCILMFNEAANTYDASISGCKFNASETVAGKAAIQMHTESGIKGNLTISDCTVSGFDSTINGGLWNEINNNTKVHTTKFTVVVNGATVQSAE